MIDLNKVLTFAEANEILGKSSQYLADLAKSGRLIENVHYRNAGRVKLINREVVMMLKEGKGKDGKRAYSYGYKLGKIVKERGNIEFVKSLLLTKRFSEEEQYEQTINDLIKLCVSHEVEFYIPLETEQDILSLEMYVMGINNGMFQDKNE